MNVVQCPHCSQPVGNDGTLAGQAVSCPRCRRRFQMPLLQAAPASPPPEPATGFEGIADDPLPSRRRRARRASGAWAALLCLLLVSLAGLIGGLWLSGVIKFKAPPNGAEQQANRVTTEDTTGKRQPENDRPRTPQGKQDTLVAGQDKKEQNLAEAARKKAEEALRNPITLQAPAGNSGIMRKYGEFAQQMRELASNEFAFRKAHDTVYRSTFNQRDQTAGLVANVWFFAFNAMLDPGSYDFESKRYSITLYFWHEYYKESAGLGGRTLPETKDYCVLRTSIEVDPDTAAKMRAAYDKKSLSLTVHYRLKRVAEGTWAENPHFNGPGRIAHNLAFEAEVLRYEWSEGVP
jgi:hypothetical protein